MTRSISRSRPRVYRGDARARDGGKRAWAVLRPYAAIIATIQDPRIRLKDGQAPGPTPLGEVVNGLMVERFSDIVNVEFTADMEKQLDRVEEGQVYWKEVLRKFYGGFHQEMLDAEQALDGVRLKVPDEVTDEKCELCGRNLVVKRAASANSLPVRAIECKFTKPITERCRAAARSAAVRF